MNRQELIDYCLTFADAYEDYPFADFSGDISWAVLRHHGNSKTFALIFERDGLCINLKCEPMQAEFYRQVYEQVTPGYHMHKVHWNTVKLNAGLADEIVYEMIAESHALTRPKERKKK